jgi:hypothetical protein
MGEDTVPEPKFMFYEIVRISRPSPGLRQNADLEGAILGMSQDDQGRWYFAVHVYELNEVQTYPETALEPTGRMDRRESFYDGTNVRVVVDPDTGEGKIIAPRPQQEPGEEGPKGA